MSFLFGGGQRQSAQQPALSGVQIQTSVQGKCIPIVYGTNRLAPNVIWLGDFVATATPSAGGGKGGVIGGGTGKGGGSGGYTYKTAMQLGLCEGPIQGIGNIYIDKNVTTAAAQGFTVFLGSYSQSAWSYLTTNHAAQALTYHGLVHVDAAGYSLGNSANLPNHNFEVKGIYSTSVSGKPDADPTLVVTDLLTNVNYGVGFPSARLGDMTNFQNYTLASGLLISPVYSSQQQAAAMIDDICKNCNVAAVWSSGTLNFIPYGDAAVTGNGKTYTPPSSTQYDLTDNDFMPNTNSTSSSQNNDPVLLTRKRQSDTINALKMEYCDNTNNYNTAVIEVKDQTSIDLYGIRSDASNNAHLFANATAAQTSAQLQMYRQQIRNIYSFTLPQKFVLLDPMDIVSATDLKLGISAQWVRLLTIDEQDDYSLVCTAEEYLTGTGSAQSANFQSNTGFGQDYNADPGLANTPIIFDAPVQLASNGGLETWLAVSGGVLWGGCDVYISSDNSTYQLAGRITGQCRMGTLTSSLPSHTDPDTVNTLAVDLSESFGQLLSGTQADADNGNTLCYVDGELISYETATLTSGYAYNLTYLRRGFYGTPIGSHNNGTNFARLDQQIFSYPYTAGQIGNTIYVKLCGFNIFGGGQQPLSEAVAYTHTLSGPTPPTPVQNFLVKQNGNVVIFQWTQVADFALKGYDIGYAPMGTTNWSLFELLTEASKGTEMTNANVPPGSWTFGIRAIDVAGQYQAGITTANLVVTNVDSVITSQEQSPDWPGTCQSLYRHWSGVLVPDDQNLASSYGWELFTSMVPTPVTDCYYITPTFDVGYDDNFRIFETNFLAPGTGETGTPQAVTYLDAWISGADPGNYVLWTVGVLDFRYANMKIDYAPVLGQVGYISEFSFTIDNAETTTTTPVTAVIGAGGTAIVFTSTYHLNPFVNPVVQGSSALYATVTGVSLTGATIHVFNNLGVDVGGTVTYTVTGS